MVSNWVGARMICIAALSTYMCESSTSGYSSWCTFVTISFHSWLTSRTLDFSTEHSRLLRFFAVSNPTRAMRSISGTE